MVKNFRKSKLWNVFSWIFTILAAFVVALLVNTYLIRTSNINGSSMDDSYHEGQLVVLSKAPYLFGVPEYKDVVVFDSSCLDNPNYTRTFFDNIEDSIKYNLITQKVGEIFNLGIANDHRFWIKRVIGVPGDKIEFKDGKIYKNDILLEEDYIREQNVLNNPEGVSFTVPEGKVLLCGDNRNRSMDCRSFVDGKALKCVPYEAILGKVLTEAQPQGGK